MYNQFLLDTNMKICMVTLLMITQLLQWQIMIQLVPAQFPVQLAFEYSSESSANYSESPAANASTSSSGSSNISQNSHATCEWVIAMGILLKMKVGRH